MACLGGLAMLTFERAVMPVTHMELLGCLWKPECKELRQCGLNHVHQIPKQFISILSLRTCDRLWRAMFNIWAQTCGVASRGSTANLYLSNVWMFMLRCRFSARPGLGITSWKMFARNRRSSSRVGREPSLHCRLSWPPDSALGDDRDEDEQRATARALLRPLTLDPLLEGSLYHNDMTVMTRAPSQFTITLSRDALNGGSQ